MKYLRKIIYALVFMLVLGLVSNAADENTGTTSANFLKIGGGVRAASMGGAFIAVADDPSGIYWNPAGIFQLESPELSSTYSSWLAGISSASISYAGPWDQSAFGASFDYISIGGIEETTTGQPAGTGRVFNPSDYSFSLAFARPLLRNLAIGWNVKIINETIDAGGSTGYALDIGAIWRVKRDLTVGLAARNAIGSLAGGIPPANYGLGVALQMSHLLISADFNLPSDNQSRLDFGGEYNINDVLFCRLGYNTRNERDAGGNLSGGLGLKMRNACFDYAYIPYGELGSTHRFSFGLEFGQPAKEPVKPFVEVSAKPELVTSEASKIVARQPAQQPPKPWKYDPKLALELYKEYNSGKVYSSDYGYENWQLKKFLLYKAKSAEDKNEYAEAIKNYQSILEIDPSNPFASKRIGILKTGLEP